MEPVQTRIVAASAVAAVLLLGFPSTAAAQEPTCDLHLVGDGYRVCYESGYDRDAELTREIVDRSARRLRRKYGRPPAFDLDVKLYATPTDAVYAGRTYFDGSAIHYLTPSAPERQGGRSVLGLPLDSTEFHYKTLTHEYMHAFHLATNPVSFRWSGWFTEAVAEFEGTFSTAPQNGQALYDRLIAYVHDERSGHVSCCRTLRPGTQALMTTDAYFAGTAILKFLEDEFGADILVRLLKSESGTLETALSEELTARTLPETFTRLQEWLGDRYGQLSRPDYTPSMACTGRYWQSSSGLSFEVRIVNSAQRPSDFTRFTSQYRRDASRSWTTNPTGSIVGLEVSAFGVSPPLFTGPSSPPFQWRARACPSGGQYSLCSQWSNVINWTAESCARTEVG